MTEFRHDDEDEYPLSTYGCIDTVVAVVTFAIIAAFSAYMAWQIRWR